MLIIEDTGQIQTILQQKSNQGSIFCQFEYLSGILNLPATLVTFGHITEGLWDTDTCRKLWGEIMVKFGFVCPVFHERKKKPKTARRNMITKKPHLAHPSVDADAEIHIPAFANRGAG